MLIFLLLVLLIILIAVYYIANNREALSATILMSAVYIIMCITAIGAKDYYNINDISLETVILIPLSISFFGMGEYLGRFGYIIQPNKCDIYDMPANTIVFRNFFVIAVGFYSAITAYLCFQDIMLLAARSGLVGDFSIVFETLRNRLVRGLIVYERSTLLNQMVIVDEVLIYILIYSFAINLIYFKVKKIIYLLPTIPYLVILFTSTSRTAFIEFITVVCFVIFILMKIKSRWAHSVNRKIVRISIIALVIFYGLFRYLGTFTGKTETIGAVENLYEYFSSSLFGFDSFISTSYEQSDYFGALTLRSLYMILNKFGAGIHLAAEFNPSYTIGRGSTVMLSGLYRPIIDYGIMGMLLTRLLIGFLYGRILNGMKRIQFNNYISIIFVGLLFYPVVMNPLSDLFGRVISLGYLYRFVYMLFFYRILLQKKLEKGDKR